MRIRIRKLPGKAPGAPPEYPTEMFFIRDGHQLDCPPLRPGEVVEVPDDEVEALIATGIVEVTDQGANRDLINESWQPTIPQRQPAQQKSSEDVAALRETVMQQAGLLQDAAERAKRQDAAIETLSARLDLMAKNMEPEPDAAPDPALASGLTGLPAGAAPPLSPSAAPAEQAPAAAPAEQAPAAAPAGGGRRRRSPASS